MRCPLAQLGKGAFALLTCTVDRFFFKGFIAVRRSELIGREGDAAEHLAGIFSAAGIVTAFLAGNGIIQYRHHQLCIPLQPDDGELSECYKQLPVSAGKYQWGFIISIRLRSKGLGI